MKKEKWKPSSSKKVIYLRHEIIKKLRLFFENNNFLEVDTPSLLSTGITDPNIESLVVRETYFNDKLYYLHTSPEFYMKRLLAYLKKDIYQICKTYRANELGKWNEPEFTLLEWYRVGWNELELLEEVENIIRIVLSPYIKINKVIKYRYIDLFKDVLSINNLNKEDLSQAIRKHNIPIPSNATKNQLLDIALTQIIVNKLENNSIIFIYNYPQDQCSLAKIDKEKEIAQRFEVFFNGIEIGNGFNELTDVHEQRNRFIKDNKIRKKLNKIEHQLDEEFLAALEYGLPECSGVALGLDRLIAIAADVDNINESITFSHSD